MDKMHFEVNAEISVDEYVELIKSTSIGERRPLNDLQRMEGMLKNSNLIVTVRHGKSLVGMARAITDFFWVAYISDLAVGPNFQRIGLGKKLILKLRNELSDECKLFLLAAPSAVGYYPHIGFLKEDRGWVLPSGLDISK